MANNFTLITKAGGTVTAANDGAVHASALPDCRLDGCVVTVSGNTCNISAGAFVMCGRVIASTSATSLTIPTTQAKAYIMATISNGRFDLMAMAGAAPAYQNTDINLDTAGLYGLNFATFDIVDGAPALTSALPYYQTNGGIISGTGDAPSGNFAENTLYIKY